MITMTWKIHTFCISISFREPFEKCLRKVNERVYFFFGQNSQSNVHALSQPYIKCLVTNSVCVCVEITFNSQISTCYILCARKKWKQVIEKRSRKIKINETNFWSAFKTIRYFIIFFICIIYVAAYFILLFGCYCFHPKI